jgi:DNA-binding NarL/FixJ family response regulator
MFLIVHQRVDQVGLSAGVTDTLLMAVRQLAKLLKCVVASHCHPDTLGGPFDRLTDREWVVLRGLNSDQGEKQLADRLNLSPHTLHSHIKSIYRKVGVQGRLPLLLRLNEAIRDLRTTTINTHSSPVFTENREMAAAVG